MKTRAYASAIILSFAVGGLCLFTSEAYCARDWVHGITRYPGLWRGWAGTFTGWAIIVSTLSFLIARLLSCYSKAVASWIRWITVILMCLVVLAFIIFNVMWGIHTDWTFAK